MEALVGPRIRLRPLQRSDADALVQAASDGELWNLPFTVVPSALTVLDYIDAALEGQAAGTVAPFVPEIIETQQLVGPTRYWKLDAVQEGIVRNERIMPNGRVRNSVRLSIIDTEWPDVRARLIERMSTHRTSTPIQE